MKAQDLFKLRDPISVEEWLCRWLDGPGSAMTPRVFDERRKFVERRILPSLGSRMLHELQPDDVAALVSAWQDEGAAPNTIRHRFFALNGMLSDARRQRLMWRNPCSGVPVPSREESTFEWTPKSLRSQIDVLASSGCEEVGLLIMGSALRPVELYNAAVDDYDPSQRLLHVSYPGRYVVIPRTISLPRFAADAIDRMLLAARQKRSKFLWSMADGRQCSRTHFNQVLRDGFAAAGTPPTIRCSDMRRAFAFLATKADLTDSIVAYYMKMRPRSATPSMQDLALAMSRLDQQFHALVADGSPK